MNSFSLIGFTRGLISGCTSRMEFATSKGTPSRWPKGYKLITSVDRFANEP